MENRPDAVLSGNSIDRILIIQTAFLGDVILITPLIRAVKNLYPRALVDVMVIPQTAGVLKNNPWIHQVIQFDKRKNKLSAFWKTVSRLKKNRYDLALSPHSSMTSALLMVFAGIRRRIGFDRWHASKYLTHKVVHPHNDRNWHKIDKNLNLLTVLSDERFERQTELFPDETEDQQALNYVKQAVYPGRPYVALAPGSIWATKRWPEEHYTELSRMLDSEAFNQVFIGGPDERALCAEIIKNAEVKALNIAGETSILGSAAVISRCDLLICNDSGALHIANAMQTDLFAFFGPTVQRIGYFPYRENDRIFELDMECRPCGSHGSQQCKLEHHKCMKNILPEVVFEYIKKKL